MLWAFTALEGTAQIVMSLFRSVLICVALVSLLSWTAAPQTSAQSSVKKSLHGFVAAGKGSKRSTTFSADAPVIFVFWKGEGLAVGDLVGVIWFAEDVGKASAKDTEIRRADFKVYKQEDEKAHSRSHGPSARPGRLAGTESSSLSTAASPRSRSSRSRRV